MKQFIEATGTQGDDDWIAARKGMPTASAFKRIVTPKTKKPAAGYTTYSIELALDCVLDKEESWGGNEATNRGHELEPKARDWYKHYRAMVDGAEITVNEVGFRTDLLSRYGCTPDGDVIGDSEGYGGLEIKCFLDKHHTEAIVHHSETGLQLPEQWPQTMGQMLVCHYDFVDTVYWHPDLPKICIRTYPDPDLFDLLTMQIQSTIDYRQYVINLLEG